MDRNAKILIPLLLAGLVVAGCAAFLLWRYLDARHDPDGWREAGKAALRQGHHDGAGMDDAGCIEGGFVRLGRDGSLGSLDTRLWFKGCLDESRPGDGTCRQVPSVHDVRASGRWTRGFCGARGFHDHAGCKGLASVLQGHCAALAEAKQ